MKQQTAVEWFFNKLSEKTQANNEKEYWEAKAMEKEQIVTAFLNGDDLSHLDPKMQHDEAEQYYNKIYNK
jgi:hypothetical protein